MVIMYYTVPDTAYGICFTYLIVYYLLSKLSTDLIIYYLKGLLAFRNGVCLFVYVLLLFHQLQLDSHTKRINCTKLMICRVCVHTL